MADQPPRPLEWVIFGSILPLIKEMWILGLLTIATIAITRFKYAAFLPE